MANEEYPLYPTLPEAAKEDAQKIIDQFKAQMVKVAEDAIGNLYTDVSMYVESDHWQNYRNQILDGMCNYGNRKIQGEHDFARIRKAILKEHREEIITDLNQDMVKEIAALKEHIKWLEEARRL